MTVGQLANTTGGYLVTTFAHHTLTILAQAEWGARTTSSKSLNVLKRILCLCHVQDEVSMQSVSFELHNVLISFRLTTWTSWSFETESGNMSSAHF